MVHSAEKFCNNKIFWPPPISTTAIPRSLTATPLINSIQCLGTNGGTQMFFPFSKIYSVNQLHIIFLDFFLFKAFGGKQKVRNRVLVGTNFTSSFELTLWASETPGMPVLTWCRPLTSQRMTPLEELRDLCTVTLFRRSTNWFAPHLQRTLRLSGLCSGLDIVQSTRAW